MTENFAPLTAMPLEVGVTIHRTDRVFNDNVTLDDPALVVMTDLRKVTAVTIDPMSTIKVAGRRMKQRGVRLLLVVDVHDAILGLITSTDLQGEKPMQHIQNHGGKWNEILVQDVMTPQVKMDVLCMEDVAGARVGNVVATLRRAGRQHALVVDRGSPGEKQVLRGIFSASQIARQLDMEIQTTEIAQTFAEIERLLIHAA